MYGDVQDHEADKALLGNQVERLQPPHGACRFPKHLYILWPLSILIAFGTGILLQRLQIITSSNFCFHRTSATSPLLSSLTLTYTNKQFNGSFMHENIYRQPGSPEVDTAWEALGVDYRPLRIPEQLAQEANLRNDHVRINPKYGGGYPANVEGLHHLHCLNLLRKALYYNYDYYRELGEGAFENEDHVVRYHVSHCLDILRQQLMCSVDIGVLGQVWYNPQSPSSFVDFNTQHKCRNYDEIRQWAEERQLPEDVPDDFLRPPEEAWILGAIP